MRRASVLVPDAWGPETAVGLRQAARGRHGCAPSALLTARLTDFAGPPPAYLEVGDLDIFRDEVIA